MAWIDDALPMPAARPLEGEEALEAAAHALAALAAGIAAMQAFMAIVVGEALPAMFFAAALSATAACAFVSDGSRLRRAAYLAGGCATVAVWLAVLPQASGHTMAVVIAMAGLSALVTRRLLIGDAESSDAPVPPPAIDVEPRVGWIEDDREGALTA